MVLPILVDSVPFKKQTQPVRSTPPKSFKRQFNTPAAYSAYTKVYRSSLVWFIQTPGFSSLTDQTTVNNRGVGRNILASGISHRFGRISADLIQSVI